MVQKMTVVPMRPDAPKTNNPFRYFHELGWPNLVPLMPADAQVSPQWEYVQRAIRKHGEEKALAQMRGKAPAALWRDGKWGGFKGWRTYQTTDEDLDTWHQWGANVGFRMPPDWIIFDIDITDSHWAEEAERIIVAELGPSPCRIGLAPKRMLFYRLTDPVKGGWVFTKTGEKTQAVEMFTDGRQVALFGMHRAANRPYQWPRKPVHRDDITLIRPDQYEAVQAALLKALPEASSRRESTVVDRETVPQESLRGDPEAVRRAMAAIPNSRAIYPSRDDYIRMGAALKAALPDDEDEAFHLWTEWAEKDNGGEPEVWRKDWNGLGGTFAIGANWVYAQADKHGDGSFTSAEVHFEPVPEREPSPFDTQAAIEREQADDDIFPVLRLQDIEDRPPPRFLVDRHIPQVSTGFLYSAPGVGKSFLALDMALSIAFGAADWHGDPIDAGDDNPCVLYLAAEGSFGFRNRVRAWREARGFGKDEPNRFTMIERTIDFMDPNDITKLIRTVRKAVQRRPCLVIVDTVSRSMPGADENLQKEMTLFVKACDEVKDAFQCAVLGVHHAGKSGDMRGSTVLRGAGDFVFKLERTKGKSVGRLTCEKQKDGPDGWEEPYVFEKADLADGQTSLVVARAALPGGRDGAMSPTAASRVLAAMKVAWDVGSPWGKTRRSGDDYAVDRMVRDFGLTAEQAESYLGLWLADGTVDVAEVSRKTKKMGYRVLREGVGHFQPVQVTSEEAYETQNDDVDVFD